MSAKDMKTYLIINQSSNSKFNTNSSSKSSYS